MSFHWNVRTELLLGKERAEHLSRSHVLVVGLGGVGAYAAEMVCRAGIGKLTIIDADTVNESNLNRQLPSLHSTLGQPKAEVMARRLLDINPELELTVYREFIRDTRTEEILDSAPFDFVVDAIDSVSPKAYLMYHARMRGLPLISSMGAGAKSDPAQVKIDDLSNTYNCGLAKAMRKRLSGMGIKKGIPVVFSTELPDKQAIMPVENEACKLTTAGTVSYMPAVFGCFLASYVIRKMCNGNDDSNPSDKKKLR